MFQLFYPITVWIRTAYTPSHELQIPTAIAWNS